MPSILDPNNEWAVTRVELMDGEVRAMQWDHEVIEHAAESLVVTLIPAAATIEADNPRAHASPIP